MTDRELLQQALDALKHLCLHSAAIKGYDGEQVQTAIDALRARLAQPEPAQCDGGQCGIGGYCKECPKTKPEQKSITMVVSETGDPSVTMSWWHEPALPVGTKLYTAPPQREWVGLTDEEINILFKNSLKSIPTGVIWNISRTIEAKLKEKNT